MFNLSGGKVHMVIDGQWGSGGKGKLCAFLADKFRPDLVVACFGPNAGHTAMVGRNKYVSKVVPISAAFCAGMMAVGPAAVFDPDRLIQEMREFDCEDRLFIDPHAVPLRPEHAAEERVHLRHIASTMQGNGVAKTQKMMRVPHALLGDGQGFPALKRHICDVSALVHQQLAAGKVVLMEGCQGFDLSLDHGHEYPYVTSRNVTPMAMLDDIGVPPRHLGEVIGVIRPFPIRVGNIEDGQSGPHHKDQREIQWSDVEAAANAPPGVSLKETTTVTRRTRRVFTFSETQYRRFVRVCDPTSLYIGFADHFDYANRGVREWDRLSQSARLFAKNLEEMAPRSVVRWFGTGPDHFDMVNVTL